MKELISEVRSLLKQVPSPPDSSLPPGAEEGEIRAFEERTGIQLPSEVKNWLRTSNGPLVGPGGVFGILSSSPSNVQADDMEAILRIYPEWKERHWLPIAGDGSGNYYIIPLGLYSKTGHPVFFIDTSDDHLKFGYSVASDLWHFLRFLFRRELGNKYWPFNKDRVLEEDPELEYVTGAPKAWESDDA